eukprot:scaffold112339_cov57-Phaeocystis_antarctica.AAC.3
MVAMRELRSREVAEDRGWALHVPPAGAYTSPTAVARPTKVRTAESHMEEVIGCCAATRRPGSTRVSFSSLGRKRTGRVPRISERTTWL